MRLQAEAPPLPPPPCDVHQSRRYRVVSVHAYDVHSKITARCVFTFVFLELFNVIKCTILQQIYTDNTNILTDCWLYVMVRGELGSTGLCCTLVVQLKGHALFQPGGGTDIYLT